VNRERLIIKTRCHSNTEESIHEIDDRYQDERVCYVKII